MLTVHETPDFIAWSAKVWADSERFEFIAWISENPMAGDVIPGAGPLRKVRWTRKCMGKSGGARLINFNRFVNGDTVLSLVYNNAKFDNLRPELLLKLKERFDA